jgi:hypothetical protein
MVMPPPVGERGMHIALVELPVHFEGLGKQLQLMQL